MTDLTTTERREIFKLDELRMIDSFELDEALELPAGIQLDVLVAQTISPHVYKQKELLNLKSEPEGGPHRYFVIYESHGHPLELYEYKYTGGHAEGYFPTTRYDLLFSGCAGGAMNLLYGEGLLRHWGNDINFHFHSPEKLTLKIGDKDYGTGDPSMVICKAILQTRWPKK